jgi:hypothetical protein
MPNLASRPFELIIAGIDRSAAMDSIDLQQPSTLEQRHAPVNGKINLRFSSRDLNDYIPITSPTAAASWAAGALVTFRIANSSGTLVYHPLSGQQLFILKPPSPPSGNILSLEVGCILAYQDQRTADRDVSGVEIGTNTDRDEIVRRVLTDAGISSFSIPELPYPFNTPVQKTGGSAVKLAGDLVGADRHVLYCNASGTVIAAPIDLDASPIATLTIGQDESDFDPVDGSSIPTATELTISGVCQVPDQGDYPILSITEKYINYEGALYSKQFRVLVNRETQEIVSENYGASFKEIHYFQIIVNPVSGLFELQEGSWFTIGVQEDFTYFDSSNRLSRKIHKEYLRLNSLIPETLEPLAITPFLESKRTVEDYEYNPVTGAISEIRIANYLGQIEIGSTSALLFPSTRTSTIYQQSGTFWNKATALEANFTGQSFAGNIRRDLNINGTLIQVIGCADEINPLFTENTTESQFKNDDSTRPPSTTYSEAIKTKNIEITSIVNAIPLAGVPSKEKLQPLTVDWLVSGEQAYEYGQLEIVLMNGRKQCRFMITGLTDELLALRPRARIDIIFNSILYRCLADAITFSQDLTRRTIGFMCDVISTSPVATPSTVYQVIKPINSIRGLIAIDAIVTGNIIQTFDTGSIIIDAVVTGVLAEQGQIEGEIVIDALVFGVLST